MHAMRAPQRVAPFPGCASRRGRVIDRRAAWLGVWRVIAVVCVLGGGPVSTASAQDVADLHGRVIDQATGAALADVVVRLPGLRRYTMSDELGEFRLNGVPAGPQLVEFARLGYGELRQILDVRTDSSHVIRLELQPVMLDAIEVSDDRRLRRVMNNAAMSRAHDMIRGYGHAFWHSWDREQIEASGISDPLEFLRDGPPRLQIRPCVGLGAPRDRLCLGVFGSSGRARIFLDDRPLGALEDLPRYSMVDIERVETYGMRGEAGIRLYSRGYLTLVSLGEIDPAARSRWAAPDLFEPLRLRADSLRY